MLRSSVLVALLLLVLAPFARAQTEDANTINAKAVAALQAKKFDEGIALLMRVLELSPKDKGTAYNLGCAYSLKGEPDKAFEWLDKSLEWGWGTGTGTIAGTQEVRSELDMLKKDTDFDNVRKDPRFEKILERVAKVVEDRDAARKKTEEFASAAAVYVPEKAKGLAEMPLLVVLHDAGSSKDEVVKGRWKAVADELGFALVAPSGKVPVGDDPTKGMRWFADRKEYTQKAWSFEKPVHDAVSAFKKEHPIDAARVVVAGEGQGGLVALDVAIGSPGLYKGAVALNGVLDPELMATKAPGAGKAGLKVRLLCEDGPVKKLLAEGGQAEADVATVITAWNKFLQTWGLSGEARSFTVVDAEPQRTTKALVEAVLAVLPAAKPAEAGAPK